MQTKGFKSAKDLVFSDNFMFTTILKNEKVCKGVIERLLKIKVDHIEYPELEKTLAPFYTQRGIRMDVYISAIFNK